jgi:DNA-binding HxlR family transcriptional regulator
MAGKSTAGRTERETKAAGTARRGAAPHRAGAATGLSAERSAIALEQLIHERTRLGIISALAVNETLRFNELKQLLGITDGNLSVHARKLEDAGYIACTKSFANRLPKTEYSLTTAGRRALEKYLNHMESLIRATREG